MSASRACALATILISIQGLNPAVATAQGVAPGFSAASLNRFEASFGAQFAASSSLGSRDANLTTGTGGVLRLFNTSTTVRPATGFEGRLGIRLTQRIDLEVFGAYAKPEIRTQITSDLEDSGSTNAVESVKQYVVGGGAVWNLGDPQRPGRLRPFLIGNAAFLRQLHDSNTLARNGQQFEAGAGIKYPLATSRPSRTGRVKTLGLRADLRVQARRRGIEFDDRVHYAPAATAMLFIRF